jgi:hypothetical protein
MTRQRALIALMALELAIVAWAAIRYTTDGAAATATALLLAPVAVWAVAAAGDRLGGRPFGLLAAAAYVALPALGTRYMLVSYRSTFSHDVIPNLLGLRATPWFALGVGITLAVAYAPHVILAAVGVAAALAALIAWGTDPLAGIRAGLHETAWSITLLEWFVLAGSLGAARRSIWLAIALFGWLVAATLHGAHGGYDDAAFWRSLSVAAPAAALLLSSLVLLVPPLRRPRPAQSPGHSG